MSVTVIQPDWVAGLRCKENIFAYHKILGQVSTNGHLGDDDFKIIAKSGRTMLVKCSITQQETLYIAPVTNYEAVHSKSIYSLDIAGTGDLGVSISSDDKITIWNTSTGSVKARLSGHLFDVSDVKFFPSGNSILSASADMQIKIWDSHSYDCKWTLKGHRGTVNDTAIVECGKNIISVSKDCTVRLWNVCKEKCLAELLKTEAAINCCAITTAQNDMELPSLRINEDELEEGTKGKNLAVGCEDGKVILLDIFSRKILASYDLSCEITSMKWFKSTYLVIGLENGSINIINLKKLNEEPVKLSHDSRSSVLCICPIQDGFFAGRRDGLCQFYDENGISKIHLTGPDCDAVSSISYHEGYVFIACRDHIIRKYAISDMNL